MHSMGRPYPWAAKNIGAGSNVQGRSDRGLLPCSRIHGLVSRAVVTSFPRKRESTTIDPRFRGDDTAGRADGRSMSSTSCGASGGGNSRWPTSMRRRRRWRACAACCSGDVLIVAFGMSVPSAVRHRRYREPPRAPENPPAATTAARPGVLGIPGQGEYPPDVETFHRNVSTRCGKDRWSR